MGVCRKRVLWLAVCACAITATAAGFLLIRMRSPRPYRYYNPPIHYGKGLTQLSSEELALLEETAKIRREEYLHSSEFGNKRAEKFYQMADTFGQFCDIFGAQRTREQTLNFLGNPDRRETSVEGEETWSYEWYNSQAGESCFTCFRFRGNICVNWYYVYSADTAKPDKSEPSPNRTERNVDARGSEAQLTNTSGTE